MNKNLITQDITSLINSTGLNNLFRIIQLEVNETSHQYCRVKAEIYNHQATLSVSWISETKPLELRKGDVVNVTWMTQKAFNTGSNIILGLNKITQLQERDCVLTTVPPSWIKNPEAYTAFVSLIQSLDKDQQSLLQHILLKTPVLYRFLTGPFQLRGQYSRLGGNLQKTIEEVSTYLNTEPKNGGTLDTNTHATALLLLGIGRNKQFDLDSPNKKFIRSKYPAPNIEALTLIIDNVDHCDMDNKQLLTLIRILYNM